MKKRAHAKDENFEKTGSRGDGSGKLAWVLTNALDPKKRAASAKSHWQESLACALRMPLGTSPSCSMHGCLGLTCSVLF